MHQPQPISRLQPDGSIPNRLSTNTTPFPNYLLNEVMPALRDTEWRLLCVIVRQTLGWHDKQSGGRKSHDWMSRSQLMQKTGRNSEALSQALDSLIQSNLIEAKSTSGQPLPTTAIRRQIRGRIFYALHPLLMQRIAGNEQSDSERTEAGGETVDNFTKSEHEIPQNTLTSSVFCHEGRKIEHRKVEKPNRTKETLTKITETKEKQTKRVFFQNGEYGDSFKDTTHALDSLFDTERVWGSQSIHQLPVAMQQFIAFYSEQYARHFPDSTVPVIFTSALRRLEGVLAKHSTSELTELLDRFFISDLAHIKRQWYSLEAFVHNIEILKETKNDS